MTLNLWLGNTSLIGERIGGEEVSDDLLDDPSGNSFASFQKLETSVNTYAYSFRTFIVHLLHTLDIQLRSFQNGAMKIVTYLF